MFATDFLRSKGLTVSSRPTGKVGRGEPNWEVIWPSGYRLALSLDEVEHIALDFGWTPPKDENGFASAFGKSPCSQCGYAPGFMSMYTNGERILCANCRPINNRERANYQAFARCEAAYLEDPR